MDDIMQGIRHQNPNLFTYASIKDEQKLVDLKFLSIKMQITPEQLHKMGLILEHRRATLW